MTRLSPKDLIPLYQKGLDDRRLALAHLPRVGSNINREDARVLEQAVELRREIDKISEHIRRLERLAK